MKIQENEDVSLTLRLVDTEESRKMWDFKFSLDYKVRGHNASIFRMISTITIRSVVRRRYVGTGTY